MPYRIVKHPWAGVAMTAGAMLVVEVARATTPDLVHVAVLLLTLAPVAYSALSGGLWPGMASAGLLSVYTLHYVSEDAFLTPTAETFSSGLVMLVISTGIVLPMSYLRRREQRLVAALEQRASDLAARNAELVEANAALEAFGFVVSHDLKEPVRGVENYLDAVRQEYRGSEEGRGFLEEAYRANRRMYRLLEGLLAYSRTSTTPTTIRRMDVAEVLHSDTCRVTYEKMLQERKGQIFVDEGLPHVRGDEVILAQLFGNLVLNALRHNPRPRPTVRIMKDDTPIPAGMAGIVVEDDGPGFPADVIAKVAHLKSSRPATVKGGFGLVIAHRSVHRLGGAMRLENLPEGKGARVHLELPDGAGEPSEGGRAPH